MKSMILKLLFCASYLSIATVAYSEILEFNEKIVAVKQGNVLATAFHPELTRDISLHKSFVDMVSKSKS